MCIRDRDRTKQNRPPVAVADEYGARPGRSTTLPVLANDSDPDGDGLTADPTTQPGIGTVAPVRGGEALQITVPATASGAASFDYAADDGRGQKATATVKVTVRTPDVNAVSYTHLDVYKRQGGQSSMPSDLVRLGSPVPTQSPPTAPEAITSVRCRAPVPYTHLDGYKRQGLCGGRCV